MSKSSTLSRALDWTTDQGGNNIHVNNLTPITLTTVQTAANQSAQLALTTEAGDIVVRTDEKKTYCHNGGTASNMNDFTELQSPTDAVTSVSGATGVVADSDIDHDSLANFAANEHFVQSAITSVGTLTSLELSGNIDLADDTSIGISDTEERIEFDGAGDISVLDAKFGIGTNAPATKFHVVDNHPDWSLKHVNTHSGGYGFVMSAGGASTTSMLVMDYNETNTLFELKGNGTTYLKGNVGIGVTPLTTLHVSGNLWVDAGYSDTPMDGTPSSDDICSLIGSGGYWGLRTDNTTKGFNLDVYNGGSPISAFHVAQGGKVGIGETVPDCTFVVGAQSGTDRNNTAVAMFHGANRALDSGWAGQICVQATTMGVDIGGQIGFGIHRASSLAGPLTGAVIAGRKENATSGNYATYLHFGTRENGGNITERMRIDSNGCVSIPGKAGVNNTVLGAATGSKLTSGSNNNTFIGVDVASAVAQSNALQNTAVGRVALYQLESGDDNTAIGDGALSNTSSGGENTALGRGAGDLATTATRNTLLGTWAGYRIKNGVAHTENVLIGYKCGGGVWGSNVNTQNIAIGKSTMGGSLDGADYNICIGSSAGDTLTSGNNNILIGHVARTDAGSTDNAITIGTSILSADNRVTIGKSGSYIQCDFNSIVWSTHSDERRKKDIQDDTLGLSFINDLKTKTFRFKPAKDHPEEWGHFTDPDDENGLTERVYAELDTEQIMHGMIAQDVKAALDTAGVSTFNGWSEDKNGQQFLGGSAFIYPLIKAVQELSAKVTALENA